MMLRDECHDRRIRPLAPDHVFLVDGSNFIFAPISSHPTGQKYNFRADRLRRAIRLFCTKLLQFVRDGAAG